MAAATNSSVDQAFDVLRVVGAAPDALGVAEVARQLKLPTSTTHRVLATLFEAGYLARDPSTSKYRLGILAQELAEAFCSRFPIREASGEPIRQLVALTGESVTLSVRLGWYSVRIAGLEGWREIHAAPQLGAAAPLDVGPAAMVLLAALDADEVDRFVRWRTDDLGRKQPSRKTLVAKLAGLRKESFVVLPGADDNPSAVVFAIRDAQGRARAALTIEGGAGAFRPRPQDPAFAEWQRVAERLEADVAERPELLDDPYAHLAPEVIELPTTLHAPTRD